MHRIDLHLFQPTRSLGQPYDFSMGVVGGSVASVPEPSSLALFGIGGCVACVGAARRRRREKNQEATA